MCIGQLSKRYNLQELTHFYSAIFPDKILEYLFQGDNLYQIVFTLLTKWIFVDRCFSFT